MPRGFLLDLDGTLYTDLGAMPGGPAAIARLRSAQVPFRCLTNTTTRSRARLAERLRGYGYDIAPEEILTPARAAVAHCQALGLRKVLPLVPPAALDDLEGLELTFSGQAGAVLLGDLGEAWSFGTLQAAFLAVTAGAEMVALSRDRYFQRSGQLTLDAGPFVAALEYATRKPATLVGKPSAAFYRAALASLGVPAEQSVMVGDDLWSDIQGAQEVGVEAWLVRTGKFREETLRTSGIVPARVVGSVAELGDQAISGSGD
jgi:HAD superfamily hydrolase (TIGR01458 family)